MLPILAGPIFIAGKYVWDLYYDREQDILRRKHEKQLEQWEMQVKDFYWPLYLGLIENQAIWKYAMEHQLVFGQSICKLDETDSSESEGEDETHQGSTVVPVHYAVSKCAYRYTNGIQCGVSLSRHSKQLFGSFCMAHYITQFDYNKVSTVTWNVQESTSQESPSQTPTSKTVLVEYVMRELQDNHEKLSDIIQHHIPIISSRSRLGTYMIQFQQYMQAFELVNRVADSTGIRNPKLQGGIYPKRILPYLEQQLFHTQKMLYERTENFYKELDAKTSQSSLCCSTRRTEST